MRYDASLIQLTDSLQKNDSMYSLICLSAVQLNLILSGTRCFLDGKYLLCLNADDFLHVRNGYYEALQLRFMPYFYNVNLNHQVIGMPLYEEMRANHGYPDFHLFRHRDDSYIGILPLDEDGYRLVTGHLRRAGEFIAGHENDPMWSCRTRSEMIAVLRIAEGAGLPEEEGTDVIRYIQENIAEDHTLTSLCERFHTNRTTLSRLMKERTGMTPIQYIREERLRQSLPDLLFTFLPIGDVARKYGFTDPNYYIRLFRRRYGKTPQQYRTEGFDNRVEREEFFHKREQDVLLRSAFDRYLRGGSGQAVRILQNAEDKSIFREAFTAHLDKNQIVNRYEKELIDCFEDADALGENVVRKFLPLLESGKRLNTIPLLLLFGEEQRVEEITERLYSEAHEKLLAWLRQPESVRKRDGDPECAAAYMEITSAIGCWRKPGEERIRQILWDIADFYTYMEHPPVPEQRNPLFSILDGIGKETMYRLFDEISHDHPYGDKIHLKHEVFERTVPTTTYTPEEILEAEGFWNDFDAKYLSFASAPEWVHRTAAEQILTEADPDRRRYLIWMFLPSVIGKPPLFPLSPEQLIERAKSCTISPENDMKKRYASGEDIFMLLAKIRHPAVRTYGEQLMAENEEESLYFRYGIQMVLGSNYTAADKETLGGYLSRQERTVWRTVFTLFCDHLRTGTPTEDLPMDLLEWLWEECCVKCAQREQLARALSEGECMPEEIRQDIRYDKLLYIRRLAETEEEKSKK